MDRNWSVRSRAYKVCLISLILGFFPFVLGFGSPHWLWFNEKLKNETEVERAASFGLWVLCYSSDCSSNPLVGNPMVGDWFFSVVLFQTMALPFYLLALVAVILQNFSPRRWIRTLRIERFRQALHKDSETPEDFAFVSGFLSFVGIILFMVMTANSVSKGAYYSWAFAMSFISASVLVIVGVLMCKTHIAPPPPAQPLPEPRVVHTLSGGATSQLPRSSRRR